MGRIVSPASGLMVLGQRLFFVISASHQDRSCPPSPSGPPSIKSSLSSPQAHHW